MDNGKNEKKYTYIFDWIYNLWYTILLSMIMAVLAPVASFGGVTLKEFLDSTWIGIGIGVIIGTFVPVVAVQKKFAGIFHVTDMDSLRYLFLAKIPSTAMFVLCISCGCKLYMAGSYPGWFTDCLKGFPLSFAMAYPSGLVIHAACLDATKRMMNFVMKKTAPGKHIDSAL